MSDIEKRILSKEVLLRAVEDGGKQVITGYASMFNKRSQDLGGFIEEILPGAFASSLENDDVRGLINHQPELILGRNKSGTLRLFEDENGLKYEIDPPNTTYANDLLESLKRGDINQSSFAFEVIEDEWDVRGVLPIRYIRKVKLYDVSPVTYPAYLDTTVGVRALRKVNECALRGQATGNDGEDGANGVLANLKLRLKLEEIQ